MRGLKKGCLPFSFVSLVTGYIRSRRVRFLKFLAVGASAAAINLGFLFLLVRHMGLDTPFEQNIANALSMELSVIYNFAVSREITWGDTRREKGLNLFVQVLSFHAAVGASVLLRLALFPLLQLLGVFYLLNAAAGIGAGAVLNFMAYDRIVFKAGR
ncbi:MAG: GtrA family protein [Peptococcaceae bacterium]|nr:MAG: GtrA family protein [Peptococcaceae bacterium]